MKYTDRELDRLLEKLIASTRSPRGKFSAAASYQILEKRLPRPALRLFSLRTLSAVAAIALLCFIGWNTYCYLKPAALQTISTLADTRTIKLPDGTEVTLNHFSSLTYPEKFKLLCRITGSRHGSPVKKVSTRFSICYILLAISTIHTIIKK